MSNESDNAAEKAREKLSETGISRVLTSTSIHEHPTAFFSSGLPILKAALDVEFMRRTLEPLLRPLSSNGTVPVVTYARLVAFKHGNRGLLRYEISGAHEPKLAIFGKLYPDSNRAMRVYEIMHLLWSKVFTDQRQLNVPRPLGCIPQLSMLVYIPADGQHLDEAILDQQALRYMELAGAWLASLHKSDLPLDRQFKIDIEIANTQGWAELIGHTYPEQAEIAQRIAAYLHQRGQALPFQSDIPIHKDFHYGHILVNGGLSVIDFDEVRLGDLNFDLAHFCANFHLLSYRKKGTPYRFSTYQHAFLDSYAHHAGWVANERFVYFYIYSCLKIARQICCRRGPRPRPEGEEQRAQVKFMLDQGLAALPRSKDSGLAGNFDTQFLESPGH